MSEHVTPGDVERFLGGAFTREEMKETLRHLLKGCAACEERLRPFLQLMLTPAMPPEGAPSFKESEYDAPIARALAAAMSQKPRLQGADLVKAARGAELLRIHGHDVMALTEEEVEELRGVPFLEALLELSFEERYRNPREMLRLALCGQVAATNLHYHGYDPFTIADYQARSWAELGNAYRVNDELRKAVGAFAKAQECLAKGTGNLLVLARVADLRASLYNSQRQLADACELLDGVAQLYEKVGDDHLAGRALVSRGIYTNYEGDPQGALAILREGFALLDPERDPKLLTSTLQTILEVMVQCGEYREAATLLLKGGLREALAGEPLNLIKLRWVEGQILAGLGKYDRAESALAEARTGFLSHGQGYNAALVGLDLAAVWLHRGRKMEVRELAADMLQTFEALGIQREGLRAMEYLLWACDRDRITPRTVTHVRRFLGRLEREPQLRFEAL